MTRRASTDVDPPQEAASGRAGGGSPDAGEALDARLVERLRAREPTARLDLIERMQRPMIGILGRKLQRTDEAQIVSQVGLTLASFANDPSGYDSSKGSLLSYLVRCAWGDLMNWQASQDSRTKREQSWAESTPFRAPAAADLVVEVKQAIALIEEHFSEEEILCLQMQLRGERDVATFARELGWEGLGREDQRRKVRSLQTRVRRRVSRVAELIRAQEGVR